MDPNFAEWIITGCCREPSGAWNSSSNRDRCQPGWERAGVVLDQHAEETLDGPELRGVDHHRLLPGAVRRLELQLEPRSVPARVGTRRRSARPARRGNARWTRTSRSGSSPAAAGSRPAPGTPARTEIGAGEGGNAPA